MVLPVCLAVSQPRSFALRKFTGIIPLPPAPAVAALLGRSHTPLFYLAFEALCLQICRMRAAVKPANRSFLASSSRFALGRSGIRTYLPLGRLPDDGRRYLLYGDAHMMGTIHFSCASGAAFLLISDSTQMGGTFVR
jgi:hypothetical protein